MNNLPEKISVIIPTFNREKLVMEAIDSLRNQTYKNLEIIIVDDCSTDNTQNRIENDRDTRIVYVRHEYNKGGSQARNSGIERATGEFIAFLDSDDQWLPTKLEKQMEVFKNNSNVGIVYTGYKNVSGTSVRSEVNPHLSGNLLTEILKKNCIGTASTVLIKKNLLLEAGSFDPELPSCQDWDLYVRLAQITEFGVVEEAVVLYNEHDEGRITTNIKSVLAGHQAFYKKYSSLIIQLNKKDFHVLHVNMAKVMVRIGIVGQNRIIINKGRDFLNFAIKAYPFSIKVYLIYLGTLLNKKMLLKMYYLFKKRLLHF
ncbi:glycosyltransferase family 2 protein [Bacillus sp. sid0103]|uniref:glycosyltransferase family 2 protein n=1 Tax=Bacillus sp. sid0103 TaxID=2856337 RepID=UPI001C48186B|nr:glycosyltransferase family A protein [Bacillus sp. sid0103]MBV7505576.1 glycosyltransferase family 2 protein [Bacillus sp. sid0103]